MKQQHSSFHAHVSRRPGLRRSAFRVPRSAFSLVEMLIALAISAMLLTAVMLALNASLYAYASASETASTQSASRLVMERLLQMIRTATLHDAYDPNDASVTLGASTAPPVQSVGIQMIDSNGTNVKIWWQVNNAYGDASVGDLMYQAGTADATPLLERVLVQRDASNKPYIFTLLSKDGDSGLLLSRATVDITVECAPDTTLALETAKGATTPIRLVASTMPRKNM